MAFAMGTHARLGAGVGVSSSGGRRRSRRVQGKAPAGGEDDRVPVLYDAGGSGEAGGGGVQMEGGGEGVLQLMGGRRRRVGT